MSELESAVGGQAAGSRPSTPRPKQRVEREPAAHGAGGGFWRWFLGN